MKTLYMFIVWKYMNGFLRNQVLILNPDQSISTLNSSRVRTTNHMSLLPWMNS